MAVKKICVLGLGKTGVPLGAVIAYKCPEIRVTVVKASAEYAFKWNTGNMPPSMPGVDEFIRKCQNKNLVFSTNEVLAIKESEIIFIVSGSTLKSHGEGKNQAVDLSMIEEAAYLIAEHAESNKIVVENSSIPLKSAECMSNIFKHNSKPDVEFRVLSNPDFYEHGSSVRNLLFPDCVLIGSDNTPEGLEAAKKLSSIYERWVPSQNIITRTNWSVELSKIATSAMAAQAMASIYTISSICEESGGDVASVIRLLSKNKGTGTGFLDLSPSFGKYTMVLHNLVYMCEFLELGEVAAYWRQVLKMFTVHQERFLKKLLCTLNSNWNKKIVLLGILYDGDTQATEGSVAIDLCKSFLEESAVISIYDPRVTQGQVIEGLKSAGCKVPDDKLKKSLVVCDDPYLSARQSQMIVACGDWSKVAELNFEVMFEKMAKPAYIFDRGQSLPHEKLSDIGFKVYAVGRSIGT